MSTVGNSPIVLYASGLGPTNPPASSASGGAATAPLNQVIDDITVFVGDTQATLLFAGLAPGFPGIYQLNVIPNAPISDRVYIRVNGWQSNIASLPILPGSNAANVKGTIGALYPPASGPIISSAMFIGGTFNVAFDILPGAHPFSVVAAGESGKAVFNINPGNGTWQASLTVPRLLSIVGNFSQSGFDRVWDFSTCMSNGLCDTFPGNIIPESLMDPAELHAINLLPVLNSCENSTCSTPNGLFKWVRHPASGWAFFYQRKHSGRVRKLRRVHPDTGGRPGNAVN